MHYHWQLCQSTSGTAIFGLRGNASEYDWPDLWIMLLAQQGHTIQISYRNPTFKLNNILSELNLTWFAYKTWLNLDYKSNIIKLNINIIESMRIFVNWKIIHKTFHLWSHPVTFYILTKKYIIFSKIIYVFVLFNDEKKKRNPSAAWYKDFTSCCM